LPDSEIEQYGSLEIGEKVAAKVAKKSVLDAIEGAIHTAVMGQTVYETYTATTICAKVRKAVTAVKSISGKTAAVMSQTTYATICEYADITDRLSYSGVLDEDGKVVRGMYPEVIASVLGVDLVLIGNDIWTTNDKIAVCKIPDGGELEYRMRPELGRCYVYYTDGSPYRMESFYHADRKGHVVDCSTWYSLETFNSTAIRVLEVDTANSSSSSSTSSSSSSSTSSSSTSSSSYVQNWSTSSQSSNSSSTSSNSSSSSESSGE